MQIAQQILVLLHLIGFAALFGGVLVQLRSKEPEVNAAMLHGSLTLLITGLALVWLEEIGPDPVNYVKIAIKLVVTATGRAAGGQEPEVRLDPARALGADRRPHADERRSRCAVAVRSVVR